jgi:hypothetical protein
MDFRGVEPSRNYTVVTGADHIARALLNPTGAMLQQWGPGVGPAPNAYGQWLQNSLGQLSPQDIHDLQRGVGLENINKARALRDGQIQPTGGGDLMSAIWSALLHR